MIYFMALCRIPSTLCVCHALECSSGTFFCSIEDAWNQKQRCEYFQLMRLIRYIKLVGQPSFRAYVRFLQSSIKMLSKNNIMGYVNISLINLQMSISSVSAFLQYKRCDWTNVQLTASLFLTMHFYVNVEDIESSYWAFC